MTFPQSVRVPCCVPQLGCVYTETEEDCILAGGEHNVYECGDPLSECLEEIPPEDISELPEGCYNGPPTWDADPTKAYHTLDVCEHTVAEPTFIDEELEADWRCEPVSSHLSRAQAVGAGQNPCTVNEGFLTIDEKGDAEFLMCTGRGYTNVGYAVGLLSIPRQRTDDDDEDWAPLEQAEILFATEAPFPLELNLFSQGYICNGYPI